MGRLKGETTMTEQSYRYPKSAWAASEASAHCKSHDGIGFTAASKSEEKQEYECECVDCGHKLTTSKHCKDIKCPKCEGKMRRAERPGPGKEADDKSQAEVKPKVKLEEKPVEKEEPDIKPTDDVEPDIKPEEETETEVEPKSEDDVPEETETEEKPEEEPVEEPEETPKPLEEVPEEKPEEKPEPEKPELPIETKGVISFKDLGIAPESAPWDGTGEKAKAEVDDLKLICTWYDSDKPDAKSSYKLPHHNAEGHKCIWRGVAAAMAALLGARDGVDIPDSDKKGVYNHLKKHYNQFDKNVPDFKSVESQVLKGFSEEIHALTLDREDRYAVRLIKKILKRQTKVKKEVKVPYTKEQVKAALMVLDTALSQVSVSSLEGGGKKG